MSDACQILAQVFCTVVKTTIYFKLQYDMGLSRQASNIVFNLTYLAVTTLASARLAPTKTQVKTAFGTRGKPVGIPFLDWDVANRASETPVLPVSRRAEARYVCVERMLVVLIAGCAGVERTFVVLITRYAGVVRKLIVLSARYGQPDPVLSMIPDRGSLCRA